MDMKSVISSNVAAVGIEHGTLYVSFHNGSLYEYYDVPTYHYQGLVNAESVGSYLDTHIKKGGYRYKKLR